MFDPMAYFFTLPKLAQIYRAAKSTCHGTLTFTRISR
jgi:hypothetical protein